MKNQLLIQESNDVELTNVVLLPDELGQVGGGKITSNGAGKEGSEGS